MVFNTYHHIRTCLDIKIQIDEKKFQKNFSLPISLKAILKRSLRTRFSAKKTLFRFLSKFRFNLEISSNRGGWGSNLTPTVRATLKRSQRSWFSAKKHFFVFYRNFEFNLEISSNHDSWLKKHLKVDRGIRFYDILTKIHQKNRLFQISPNKRLFGIGFLIHILKTFDSSKVLAANPSLLVCNV